MDVFATSELFRAAVISAAHELGVFAALPATSDELADALAIAGRRRFAKLLEALVALGVLAIERGRFAVVRVPEHEPVPRAGWGLIAEVVRNDRPLALDGGDDRRMHHHLAEVGAAPARELAPLLGMSTLLDLGGGAGTYTAAFLDARSGARATLVDSADVIGFARDELARFGDRVRYIAADAREALLGDEYGAALLANVLHLHGPVTCARLCDVAACAVAPGGLVAIKDLRTGTLEAALFALNMAIYTDAGDVYAPVQLREWLIQAGLVDVEEHRLVTSPDAIVVTGRRPAEDAIARRLDGALSRIGKVAWRELAAAGGLRAEARPTRLRFPAPLRRMLSRAIALGGDDAIERHYIEVMPRMRVAQLAGTAEPAATLMHVPLDWSRLPRLTAAIERWCALFTVERPYPPTLAALYASTHYGACMPLLYGYPADLAYFMARGAERGLDVHGIIDRYLTVPILHELCHGRRDREALPLHLDECVAGWLGIHLWPEFAYPEPGEDDAIFAAPWLGQIGQAIARAFGIDAVVRGHTGAATWRSVIPAGFLTAAERLCWDDWRARRTLHFLSDTLAPQPWLALALAAGAGHSLAEHTLDSLAAVPLATLELPIDEAFDHAIVEDGLRAMCLSNVQVDGTFRAYTQVPEAAIAIDAHACRVTTPKRGVDRIDPSYWLPPAVAARLAARGIAGYSLRLSRIEVIPGVAAAICSASRGHEADGFALVLR